MKKAALILMLVITTTAFSACGANSNNSKAKHNKTKVTSSKATSGTESSATSTTPSTENDDEIITDIANWNHPVKEVFNAEEIKVDKVELKNNKTYAIFYVELTKDLNDENKSYYVNLINKVAAANGYWDYEINDQNKNIDITVKCKDKASVESIEYNKDSTYFSETTTTPTTVSNNELIDYLKQNVPEVSSYVDTLSKNKNVTPILYIERSPNPSSSDPYLRDYYIIYVGEQHEDHITNTYTFAINKDNKQILYYDVANNKYETLQEWRNNRK